MFDEIIKRVEEEILKTAKPDIGITTCKINNNHITLFVDGNAICIYSHNQNKINEYEELAQKRGYNTFIKEYKDLRRDRYELFIY